MLGTRRANSSSYRSSRSLTIPRPFHGPSPTHVQWARDHEGGVGPFNLCMLFAPSHGNLCRFSTTYTYPILTHMITYSSIPSLNFHSFFASFSFLIWWGGRVMLGWCTSIWTRPKTHMVPLDLRVWTNCTLSMVQVFCFEMDIKNM